MYYSRAIYDFHINVWNNFRINDSKHSIRSDFFVLCIVSFDAKEGGGKV